MFPKIDLHCHLDGSLSDGTIRKLAARSGIVLPNDTDELKTLLSAPQDCESLVQYLKCFDLPVACLQTDENLFDAAKSVVTAAAEDDVIYIEVRFAPLLHKNQGMSTELVIRSVLDGIKSGVAEVRNTGHMMEAGVIVCGMRHMPVEENVAMLKVASNFWQSGICGVDIAGDEASYPPIGQKAFFDLANNIGIPITIHAGECGNVQNVLDAVALGAKRIGHGIALCKDIQARQIIRDKGIFLEMCPTSNLQTKAVDTWENYPLRLFLNEGLKVTVNTDNRTVSQTTMADEFSKLEKYCGLMSADKKVMLENSIDAAFASDEVKTMFRQYMEDIKND